MIPVSMLTFQPGEGEHLQEDGLIHCDTCGSPRQVLITLNGKQWTPRCKCLCQKQQEEALEEEKRRAAENIRRQRLRDAGMQDPALHKCTFQASRFDTDVIRYAKNYVNHWEEMQREGLGLFLWGRPGTGKTFAAGCICNALVDRDVPVIMTSFPRILGALPGPAAGERTAMIDRLVDYPLLVLDDFGVERSTEYTMEMIYHIIDARYRQDKPMILTSNLTLQELENPDSLAKARIYERILERCMSVCVNGMSIRQARQEANWDNIRRMLVQPCGQ